MTKAEELFICVENLEDYEHPFWDCLEEIDPDAKHLDTEIISEHRWFDRVAQYYKLTDDTFVAIEFNEPSTEMQEGQPYSSKAYLVEPYEITVTKYRKITNE